MSARRNLTVLLMALWPALASAQVAPGVFTTVRTNSTAATSICVGCPASAPTVPAANSGITAATLVLPSGVPSVTTNKLYSSGGALFFNGLAIATGGSINGTSGTIGKFTAATVIGDSIITDSGTAVTIAGATQSNGNVTTGTNGSAGNLIVNGPAGTNRTHIWRTAGLARWISYATDVAETGANAGSNYRLDAYNDAGTVIGSAIFVTRSSMAVVLGQNLTVTGTSTLSGGATAGTSFQLTGAAPVYLANTNNGYLFRNAANGATLLSITDAGVAQIPNLTASQAVFTDASKNLVSNAITGTGNVVMSAGPTLTGTIAGASMTLSTLTASLPVFSDGSKALVSNAMTGTGSVVMSASPTLTGTIAAASQTLSGTLTMTGQLIGAAGSGAAPSFTFAGDLNTGFFSGAANVIGVGLNGTEQITLSAATASNGTSLLVNPGAFGTGNVTGSIVGIGRNTSGNGAAGTVLYYDKNGGLRFTWVDAAGDVRVSTAAPDEDGTPSDTSGTVVGTQTSTRASKRIFGAFTDNATALATILGTPLYDFEYRSGAYNGTRFIGIVTEDSPVFGMDLGRSFNPVTAFGYTVAAFKAQAAELALLRARVAALEQR